MVRSALNSTSCLQNQVPLQTHHVRQGLGRAIVLLHPSAPIPQKRVKQSWQGRDAGLSISFANFGVCFSLKLDFHLGYVEQLVELMGREFALGGSGLAISGSHRHAKATQTSCQKWISLTDCFPSSFAGFGHATFAQRQKKTPWASFNFFSKNWNRHGFFGPFFRHGQLFRR